MFWWKKLRSARITYYSGLLFSQKALNSFNSLKLWLIIDLPAVTRHTLQRHCHSWNQQLKSNLTHFISKFDIELHFCVHYLSFEIKGNWRGTWRLMSSFLMAILRAYKQLVAVKILAIWKEVMKVSILPY